MRGLGDDRSVVNRFGWYWRPTFLFGSQPLGGGGAIGQQQIGDDADAHGDGPFDQKDLLPGVD